MTYANRSTQGDHPARVGRASSRDRAIGAAWFSGCAVLVAGAMYFHPAIASGQAWAIVLFVVLPGVAALPVGAWIAPRFLDRRVAGPWKSLALGMLVALLVHMVFAPLFAIGWWLTDPEGTSILGVAWVTLSVGFVMVGPVILPAGSLSGWLLYLIGRGRSGPGSSSLPGMTVRE